MLFKILTAVIIQIFRLLRRLFLTAISSDAKLWAEKGAAMKHFCKDWELYHQAGLDSLYETAGNLNLFLICEKPEPSALRPLPEGCSIRTCRPDELNVWKHLAAEEQYADSLTDYYERVYAGNGKDKSQDFFQRCLFLCNPSGKPVATGLIGLSYARSGFPVSTLGWFRVLPEEEGKGFGRALLSELLKRSGFPLYLHTQPTSVCAIRLYSDFGFRLLTNPVIGYRKNDLIAGLPILEKVMRPAVFNGLKFSDEGQRLHQAALSSRISEF